MSHRHQGGEEFELRLLALADDDAPPIIRLRHVLKGLLRAHGFRATSVRDVTPYPFALPADEETGGCPDPSPETPRVGERQPPI
jgi:hypothetical protein